MSAPWTPQDLERLAALARMGATLVQMGAVLGRTPGECDLALWRRLGGACSEAAQPAFPELSGDFA